jgi:hypothetical protein
LLKWRAAGRAVLTSDIFGSLAVGGILAELADLMLGALLLVLVATEVKDRVPLPAIVYLRSRRHAGPTEARCAAEMLVNDIWQPCEVLAWARRRWRWKVLVRFPDGQLGWHPYDRRSLRPGR